MMILSKKKEEISIQESFLRHKHIESLKDSSFVNNAVLFYSYNNGIYDPEYYNPVDVNIGDYIQSYAARQFMPSVSTFIDRDTLSTYEGDYVNIILNSWWYFWRKNNKFSEKFNPLFVSMHITNPEDVTQDTLSYLKKHSPIGCRDLYTRNFLLSNGIEAYFSGCLTLTLGNTFHKSEDVVRNGIYFVDYNRGVNNDIDNAIDCILTKYADSPKTNIKHCEIPLSTSPNECFRIAENLLEKYSTAKLVITSRIHCALPCLGMGTPVILVIPSFDKSRFCGLYELLNYVGFNEYNRFEINVNIDSNGCVYNKNLHIKYVDYLNQICRKFVS